MQTLMRLGWLAATSVVFAAACGGSSFSSHGSGDGGDAGSGGSSSRAGTSGTAGKPHGGNSNGGTGTAGTGTGGTNSAGDGGGGTGPGGAACTAPAEAGPCDAAMPRWFHDPSTGLCRPFIYGGCQGNENNYESLADCQEACPGGSPNYDACMAPTDCQIGGLGCCGMCDGLGITPHDLIAYTAGAVEQVYQQCQLVDILCVPCEAPPPQEESLKYFVPDCVRGECVVEDVRASHVTACQTSDDCRLRFGNGCCEACGGSNLIAVSNNGSFEDLVCGDLLPPCAACDPQLPSGVVAACVEGHCSVEYLVEPNR